MDPTNIRETLEKLDELKSTTYANASKDRMEQKYRLLDTLRDTIGSENCNNLAIRSRPDDPENTALWDKIESEVGPTLANQGKKIHSEISRLLSSSGKLHGKATAVKKRESEQGRLKNVKGELGKVAGKSKPMASRLGLDENKVHKVYRNSDGSATVVFESGAARWLKPSVVASMLTESGKIDRNKIRLKK